MQPIIFFGSSEFSVILLDKLLSAPGKTLCVTTVVTTPDKPAGRHLKLTPNPLAAFAQAKNLNVQCSMTNVQLSKGVIGLVAAYGKIIPQDVLNKFNGQIFNIHPSLLPKYRGASPLQNQILDGLTQTGVTLIQMDEHMDHGPIVAQAKDIIHPDDTWKTLGNRLFALGADLILNTQCSILNKTPIPQNHHEATYTRKLTRQDGFVPWEEFQNSNFKLKIDRMQRAYAGWPGVWSIDPHGQRTKMI